MRSCRLFVIGLICVLLQSCVSTTMMQQMQAGKISFTDGNYKIAFRQLLPVAVYGRREAQYAVGYMYYYGYGVPRDTESGLFWMSKAAEQQYCPAAKALMLIRRGPPTCDIGVEQRTEYRMAYKGDPLAKPPIMHSFDPPKPISVNVEHMPPPPIAPRVVEHGPWHSSAPVRHEVLAPIPHEVSPPIRHEISSPIRHEVSFPIRQESSSSVPFPPGIPVSPHAYLPRVSQHSNDAYGLQLYGAYKLEHVKNLQNELHLQNSTRIWHTKNQAKDWFVLTYGSYPSIADARLARDELPSNVSDLDPWVRKLSRLEKV